MVRQQFSNALLTIDEIECPDGLHFTFRVSIRTQQFEIGYTFSEMIFWQLSFKEHAEVLSIYDENDQDCKCKIDRSGIMLTIKNDHLSNDTVIKFNEFEDQDRLVDWFIEFNATCEVIFEENQKY